LIDNSGFNDNSSNDIDILQDTVYHLTGISKAIKLSSIVYFHRITGSRIGTAGFANLKMFKALYEEGNYSSVILATTMWPEIPDPKIFDREKELRDEPELHTPMLSKGAEMMRYTNTADSAMKIMDILIDQKATMVLRTQRETANSGANCMSHRRARS
jgi:hypothetical protein